MRNKRGWMRILEATIAVLIVSSVLIVVYSRQLDRGGSQADYFYNLERQILMDISSRSDLRLMVLNGDESGVSDFAGSKIPTAFGYFVRVCELGSSSDFCKIDDVDVVAEVRDKNVFVEEVVISAELGEGDDDVIYDPKKVKIFVWESRR